MQNSNGITFIEDWKKNYFKNKENKFTQLNLKKCSGNNYNAKKNELNN